MNNLKNTSEWIRKTKENMLEAEEYATKVANGESTVEFNISRRRNRCGKNIDSLIPKHNIRNYDQTMHTFITETAEMFDTLNNKIALLENEIAELKK